MRFLADASALPGNYDFVLLVPLFIACVVVPWMAIEIAARFLHRGTSEDFDDTRPGGD